MISSRLEAKEKVMELEDLAAETIPNFTVKHYWGKKWAEEARWAMGQLLVNWYTYSWETSKDMRWVWGGERYRKIFCVFLFARVIWGHNGVHVLKLDENYKPTDPGSSLNSKNKKHENHVKAHLNCFKPVIKRKSYIAFKEGG